VSQPHNLPEKDVLSSLSFFTYFYKTWSLHRKH